MKIKELERDHKKKLAAQEAQNKINEQLNDDKDSKFTRIGLFSALVIVGVLAGVFGMNRVLSTSSTSTSMENTTGEASAELEESLRSQLISQIQEAVLSDVENYLASLEGTDGYKLSDEELASIITECENNVTKYLANTDLINLTDEERETLIEGIRDEIINTVLNQEQLTNYFTEADYKNIAEYISKLTDTGLAKQLAELSETVAENNTTVTSVNKTQDKEISALQDSLSNIQTAISTGQTSDAAYMNNLKSMIDSNADLSEEYKNVLTAAIDNLSVSSASNLSSVEAALIAAINSSNEISQDNKEALIALIQNNQDSTSSGMQALQESLLAQLGDSSTTLSTMISQLTNSTAATIGDMKDLYKIYEFSSTVTNNTIVIASDDLYEYSNVNIVYTTSTENLTFNYTLTTGKLTIVVSAADGGSVPATITGTIYIDNSVMNADSE